MSDKIIELNRYQKKINSKKKSSEDLVCQISDKVLESSLTITDKAKYDITDEDFVKDMKLVHLFFVATLNRLSGIEDPNINILDSCENR